MAAQALLIKEALVAVDPASSKKSNSAISDTAADTGGARRGGENVLEKNSGELFQEPNDDEGGDDGSGAGGVSGGGVAERETHRQQHNQHHRGWLVLVWASEAGLSLLTRLFAQLKVRVR